MMKSINSNFSEMQRHRNNLLVLSQNLDTILVCLDNISNEILKDDDYRDLYLKFHKYTCDKRDYFNDRAAKIFKKMARIRNKK